MSKFTLQRVLVGLNWANEALLVAERGRTRAFVDLLLERQGSNQGLRLSDSTPTTLDQLVEIVNRQRASVLYYSLAAGYLYSWLIVPGKGESYFFLFMFSLLQRSRPTVFFGIGMNFLPSFNRISQKTLSQRFCKKQIKKNISDHEKL